MSSSQHQQKRLGRNLQKLRATRDPTLHDASQALRQTGGTPKLRCSIALKSSHYAILTIADTIRSRSKFKTPCPPLQVNSRGSNANSSGVPRRILSKSGWAGLSRKLGSPEIITLGTARTADVPALIHASPNCLVEAGGGSTRQSGGRFATGARTTKASSNSIRTATYLKSTGGFR